MAWTTPRTWVAAEVVTAALMNTHVRDNLSYLKDAPVFGGDVSLGATKKLYLDGGGNTYLYESAADTIRAVAGGTAVLQLVAGEMAVLAANLIVNATYQVYLDGGGNTYLHESSADVLGIVVGGTTAISLTATAMTLYGLAVSIGANDTAGSGYRALRVPNA